MRRNRSTSVSASRGRDIAEFRRSATAFCEELPAAKGKVPEFSVKIDNGGAPAARIGGCVREAGDERTPRQHTADGLPLHSDPPPVDNAQDAEPQPARFFQV